MIFSTSCNRDIIFKDGMLKEKTKKKRMEEDMDSLMTSINNI